MLLKIKVKEIFHDEKTYKDPEEIRRIIESHLKHLGNIKVSIIKEKKKIKFNKKDINLEALEININNNIPGTSRKIKDVIENPARYRKGYISR